MVDELSVCTELDFTSIVKSTVAFLTERLGTLRIDNNGTDNLSSTNCVEPSLFVTGALKPKSTERADTAPPLELGSDKPTSLINC